MKKLQTQLNDLGFKNKLKADLYDAYQEALKNTDFKKFVTKLNISEDILMHYTSILEDSSREYTNCSHCKGLIACQNKILGHAYLPVQVNDRLDFIYKPCKYKKMQMESTKYLDNIYMFDIPKEISSAKMKDIYFDDPVRLETIKWIDKFLKTYPKDKEQKGLYLYGSFGSGKTYLLSAMFNELAKQGYKSAIVFWPEFLSTLKSSFNTDFKLKLEKIKKAPLLLIDDIGAESTTEWSRDDIFCPIIQFRMQNKLPTFFTSNLDLSDLEKHFSVSKEKVSTIKARRIIERIKQLTDYEELISVNLRDKK
ncbi:MAG: primosomal protein DnaI [Bacilli bacterium]|nr:primosomal protein DnaI [Bacilli bacterium]